MSLPPVCFIDHPDALRDLVAEVQSEPLLALDTEANSLFAYYERVCLIQLSTRKQDYLIDPLVIEDISPLGILTADPKIEIVFHAAEYDIASLRRDFGFEFSNIFDTMIGARVAGWQAVGLSKLLDQYFDVEQDKRFQRADWGKRPLTAPQQRYAQADTHYLPALRDIVMEELSRQNALEEALELFEEYAHTRAATHEFDPNGYWSIRDARRFNLRQMAILSELYQWREKVASKRNIPRFKVLTDEKMAQLVHANPESMRDFADMRLLTRHTTQQYGLAILKALAAGRKAPLPTKPRPIHIDNAVMERHEKLKAWRKKRALDRGVESDVIVRREALWALAKANPHTPEELTALHVLGPWRLAKYGDEILQTLNANKKK